jgi:hypothetical protein
MKTKSVFCFGLSAILLALGLVLTGCENPNKPDTTVCDIPTAYQFTDWYWGGDSWENAKQKIQFGLTTAEWTSGTPIKTETIILRRISDLSDNRKNLSFETPAGGYESFTVMNKSIRVEGYTRR